MKTYSILLFLIVAGLMTKAQSTNDAALKWWDPAKSAYSGIDGQGWPQEVDQLYDRLPARAQKTVRAEVWKLSHNSAGLKIRFKTNTKYIKVRYVVTSKTYDMDRFPATGHTGVDLYSLNNDGSWAWANGKNIFADTITYEFSNLDLDTDHYKDGREFCLYLPTYNTIKWLEIGTTAGSSFTALPPRKEKPIVIYGTSIAQGGCASRPGMTWASILERNSGIPIINLGFSANGRMEKEVVELINELDARLFVLDCLPNMNASSDSTSMDTQNRIIAAVKTLRSKHPAVPILLTEHSGFIENRMDSSRRKGLLALNEASAKAFKQLQVLGVRDLYVLTTKSIGIDTDGSVDGTHPTDLGMYRYAKAYQQIISSMLNDRKAK